MPAGVFFLRNFLSQSLRQYPLSHGLRRASSPKGTPLVAVAKLLAKVQSFRQRQLRPLRRARASSPEGRAKF